MISLNGMWEVGLNRNYNKETNVPGIVYSACEPTEGSVWFKKEIQLPCGNWTRASLILYGARYRPKVYIDGECVSSCEGGLTITRHLLSSKSIKPGNRVSLEIELASFNDVPDTDASKLPEADVWRSDLSSHIWNDVYLDLHNDVRIDSVITSYDEKNDILELRYKTTVFSDKIEQKINFTLYDKDNCIEKTSIDLDLSGSGMCKMKLNGKCSLWSPDYPNLYTLETGVAGTKREQKIGIKNFTVNNLSFKLNGNPITLKMGSLCWHRWQRDEKAREIAYDEDWFLKNILLPLKNSGANTIRFHLGPPPERFIDLCDEYGMFYQAEWSFFHGLEASAESLKEQWTNWLDASLQHVSVSVIHPWNEVFECQKLADARNTLKDIVKQYPDFILSHRDVMHLHSYWWSMFENVGIYYDGKEQFDMPVLVDEFGGNYLDYEYNPGLYPDLIPAFLRFLGENNTADDRIWLQNVSHSKIAEYWRRIDIAGFSPFCMVSSPEDGNTYFEGDLKNAIFKPVFNELKAAYSPLSVSMNIWDRNFFPSQKVEAELYLFNDTSKEETIHCTYGIIGKEFQGEFSKTVQAHSKEIVRVTYTMPSLSGEYTMYASTGEISSKWDVIVTELNTNVNNRIVGILECETELKSFLENHNIPYTYDINKSDVIVGLESTYKHIKTNPDAKKHLDLAMDKGISVALLGIGPKILGPGYEADYKEKLNKVRRVNESEIERTTIAKNITLSFKEAIEPESCVQKGEKCDWIWENVNKKSMWLWNGLRGGLIIPAVEMSIFGNDKESFEIMWKSKGADIELMKKGNYYAYELAGYYEYSDSIDSKTSDKLRNKVEFLVEDAPSLKDSINLNDEILITNLYNEYHSLPSSSGSIRYSNIMKAGKGLLKSPTIIIEYYKNKSNLLISQMLFDGRLENVSDDFFGLRKDPVACQILLNIIKNL